MSKADKLNRCRSFINIASSVGNTMPAAVSIQSTNVLSKVFNRFATLVSSKLSSMYFL
jgi:hypothetical protein